MTSTKPMLRIVSTVIGCVVGPSAPAAAGRWRRSRHQAGVGVAGDQRDRRPSRKNASQPALSSWRWTWMPRSLGSLMLTPVAIKAPTPCLGLAHL